MHQLAIQTRVSSIAAITYISFHETRNPCEGGSGQKRIHIFVLLSITCRTYETQRQVHFLQAAD